MTVGVPFTTWEPRAREVVEVLSLHAEVVTVPVSGSHKDPYTQAT